MNGDSSDVSLSEEEESDSERNSDSGDESETDTSSNDGDSEVDVVGLTDEDLDCGANGMSSADGANEEHRNSDDCPNEASSGSRVYKWWEVASWGVLRW